jgi:hypothetical protein
MTSWTPERKIRLDANQIGAGREAIESITASVIG